MDSQHNELVEVYNRARHKNVNLDIHLILYGQTGDTSPDFAVDPAGGRRLTGSYKSSRIINQRIIQKVPIRLNNTDQDGRMDKDGRWNTDGYPYRQLLLSAQFVLSWLLWAVRRDNWNGIT